MRRGFDRLGLTRALDRARRRRPTGVNDRNDSTFSNPSPAAGAAGFAKRSRMSFSIANTMTPTNAVTTLETTQRSVLAPFAKLPATTAAIAKRMPPKRSSAGTMTTRLVRRFSTRNCSLRQSAPATAAQV